MSVYSHFIREQYCRDFGELLDQHIVVVRECYDGNSDKKVMDELIKKGFCRYPFCLIFNRGDRSLAECISKGIPY
jgi:hypothetical protein